MTTDVKIRDEKICKKMNILQVTKYFLVIKVKL